MSEISILDLLTVIFWGSAITIGLMAGVQFFNAGRKKEDLNEKLMMYGFACVFVITFSFAQIIFRIIDILTVYDLASLVYLELFSRVAYFSQGLGVMLLLLSLETIVRRTKYLISIVMAIFLVIIVTFPFSLVSILANSFFLGLYMVFFFLMMLFATKFSSQEFRPISSFLLFVSVLILTSMLIGSLIGPILFILGNLIALIPLKINPRLFARSKYYWNGFVISSIIFSCGYAFLLFYLNNFYHLIAYLFISIFLIYSYFYVRKITKSEQTFQRKKDLPDVLGAFVKPERITEEEVTISKEKKMCLVCKGKLTRAMYICPDCNTFYCEKCSKLLVNIENACWVCETPFDASKTVRLMKKKEEDVSKIIQKNGK